MPESQIARRYRFGVFEVDTVAGELRRKGIRIRLHTQPFQLLVLFLERPGEILTRDEIVQALWPDGTFVDYDHGVNSAIARLRDALGDSAANPRFVETLARRGYRFVAPVESLESAAQPAERMQDDSIPTVNGLAARVLATPEQLPKAPFRVVQTLFVLLQVMYMGFYVGALFNLPEIEELMAPLPSWLHAFTILIVTAAILIPARAFVLTATLFRAPASRSNFMRLWPLLLPFDILWALSPFLLLHHIHFGIALACMALLVYSPFAQRSLVLMGAGGAAVKAL